MTPTNQAKDLLYKIFEKCPYIQPKEAKKCATIAVDTVLAIKKEIWDDMHSEYFEHWQQVKTEIEKL